MGNLLGAIPTGIGDIAHSVLDSVLPKELGFLSGAVGGLIDLETGNLVGAAKNFIDSVLDLKDVAQSQKPATGTKDAPSASTAPRWCYEPPPPPPSGWRGTSPFTASATRSSAVTTPVAAPPKASSVATAAAPTGDPASLSKSSFLGLPDDALMSAIRDGKIPKEIAESKDGMLALQARMTQITEMNQLMTSMLQAIHQLRMGVIQNLRV